MGFSFEDSEFIRQLRHRHFVPSPLDDWWDDDEYGDYINYELAEYDERNDKVAQLTWEWDIKIDRALKKRRSRR